MIANQLIKRYEELGCSCKNIKLKDCLRVNTLKISEEEITSRLKKLGVKISKIKYTHTGYFYESKFSLASTAEYLSGYLYIQESASQLPPQVLDPKPSETILDMCASPGSKTTQIAAMMKNTGTIIAMDNDSRRLLSLRNNIERCGVTNTILYKKDARFANDFGIEFDKILLDAPCSGNYVKEEKFFQTKNIQGIMERSRIQKELLKAAVKSLKKNGTLVYSTCSLEPEEDEMNIDWLLTKYPEMKLEETGLEIGEPGLIKAFGKKLNPEIKKTRRFWPEKTGTEGFYIAKLKKTK
ncbi:MAG: NOL1/NOP2/sun family putative RNA methylase [Candidatus Woesearchaeota archaeon]